MEAILLFCGILLFDITNEATFAHFLIDVMAV